MGIGGMTPLKRDGTCPTAWQGCELPSPVLLAKNSLVLAKLPSRPSNLQELVPLPRELTALSPTFEDVPWHWSTRTTPTRALGPTRNALLGPDDELPALVDLDSSGGLSGKPFLPSPTPPSDTRQPLRLSPITARACWIFTTFKRATSRLPSGLTRTVGARRPEALG